MEIRELTEADTALYWPLRLRALREEPESFGASYDEAKDRPLELVAERFREMARQGEFTLGAFEGDQLVGIVAFNRRVGRKNRHIGTVYQMYVAQGARGSGAGRALMSALIARVRALEGMELLTLDVVVSNTVARALYASLGFEVYGLQRHALKLDDGRYLDEEQMVLWL